MRTWLSPVGGRALGRLPPTHDAGATLLDLTIALAIVSLLAGLTTPLVAAVREASRARAAAAFIESRCRLARQQAVARSASVGLLFDLVKGRWTFRVCADGNGNGVRRADVLAGTDRCTEGPLDVETEFPGIRIAVDPALHGPDGEPGSPDPVRLGKSNIASFSPLGSCTAGSLYLRSTTGLQYVIRLAGVTGRTRLLQYDAAALIWREP